MNSADQSIDRGETASSRVTTRFGIEFDARDDWWPIEGRREINAARLRALVTEELLDGLEMTLRYVARRYSMDAFDDYDWALRDFQKTMFTGGRIERWHLDDLRHYRATLIGRYGHEDRLGHLRSFLRHWQKEAWPGVSEQLIASLYEMKLKRPERGRAVRTRDPDKGPLTPNERHHLLQSLNDAAESGRLTLDDFSLAYLHVLTGRRPVQSASLKCKDVVVKIGDPELGHPRGRLLYLIAIPRAKQHGHGFRETRRAIDLTPSNFEVFRAQRDSVQDRFKDRLVGLGWELQQEDLQQLLGDLPLYPFWPAIESCLTAATELRASGAQGDALEAIHREAASSTWHRRPGSQRARILTVCESVGATSSDGTPLNLSASRLRYTKGTDLAREGLPLHVIAWLLDHSTSKSAAVYIDNLPEHAAEINGAISTSPTMLRFASAFRGTLVDSEEDADGGQEPRRSRLSYHGRGTATCGRFKQCGLDGGIPHACYVCSHFQPWLDGPHEAFLAELLAERADTAKELGPDSAIAKRCDMLIAAVDNVIQLCCMRRKELETAPEG